MREEGKAEKSAEAGKRELQRAAAEERMAKEMETRILQLSVNSHGTQTNVRSGTQTQTQLRTHIHTHTLA